MSHFEKEDVLKKGYLSKRGDKIKLGGWKRRYFVLLKTQKILYFATDALDDLKGTVDISDNNIASKHITKSDCVRANSAINYGIHIECEARTWEFKADTIKSRNDWITAIQKCINKSWDEDDEKTVDTEVSGADTSANGDIDNLASPTFQSTAEVSIPQIDEVPMKHALDYHLTLCKVAEMLNKANSNLIKMISGDKNKNKNKNANKNQGRESTPSSSAGGNAGAGGGDVNGLKSLLKEYQEIGSLLKPYLAADAPDEMKDSEFVNQFNNNVETRGSNMSISMGAFKNLKDFDALMNEIELEATAGDEDDAAQKYQTLPQATKTFLNRPVQCNLFFVFSFFLNHFFVSGVFITFLFFVFFD